MKYPTISFGELEIGDVFRIPHSYLFDPSDFVKTEMIKDGFFLVNSMNKKTGIRFYLSSHTPVVIEKDFSLLDDAVAEYQKSDSAPMDT